MKNEKKISDQEQKVVVDVLSEFFCVKDEQDFIAAFKFVMAKYGILEDPYTHFPVTSKEYKKIHEKWERDCVAWEYGFAR